MLDFVSTLKTRRPKVSLTAIVSDAAVVWAERQREKSPRGVFVLDGAEVSDITVGSPEGLLPLVMWHADAFYRYAIDKHGFGLVMTSADDALLHRSVHLGKVFRSNSEVLLFTVEALHDMHQHLPGCEQVPGAVELRSLVDRFVIECAVAPAAMPGPKVQ